MNMSLPAQMSNGGGIWHLYVPLLNTTARWPEHDWKRTAPVPTLTEREQALNGLGYETPPGAEWTWTEDSTTPDDPGSSVLLIAAVTVRPVTGRGAR